MSVNETILQNTRTWLKAMTGWSDSKVIVADDKGPRPAKPYLTVKVLAARSGDFGPAERVDGLNGSTPRARMQERRESTVSVQAYGADACAQLDLLALNVDSPASLTAQETAEITVLVDGGPADLSQLVDTRFEERASLDLRIRHIYRGDPADLVAVGTVSITGDLVRTTGDPDPLPIDAVYSV